MSSRRQWTWSAGALVLVVAGSGCASSSSGDAWVYAASREFYFESGEAGELFVDMFKHEPNPAAAGIALMLFALPLAFDTVALPVTIPHDVFCVVQGTTWSLLGGVLRTAGEQRGDERGDGVNGDARPAKKRIRDIWAEADEND